MTAGESYRLNPAENLRAEPWVAVVPRGLAEASLALLWAALTLVAVGGVGWATCVYGRCLPDFGEFTLATEFRQQIAQGAMPDFWDQVWIVVGRPVFWGVMAELGELFVLALGWCQVLRISRERKKWDNRRNPDNGL